MLWCHGLIGHQGDNVSGFALFVDRWQRRLGDDLDGRLCDRLLGGRSHLGDVQEGREALLIKAAAVVGW